MDTLTDLHQRAEAERALLAQFSPMELGRIALGSPSLVSITHHLEQP
ncbi:hypothetical protein [Azohydromonas caseinilytica]|uniref:Uncharacterized protein n=1 Tax=Azohydromonas caseinilytica TaxID=2728836 RepID=A0A848FCI6_9BURK|nr:hypothetical protein [Azohydromonas caseinilytica]NML17048.1 hypothetical protein [Azohydromonas caseinilytica]